jgi:hypothetical protein
MLCWHYIYYRQYVLINVFVTLFVYVQGSITKWVLVMQSVKVICPHIGIRDII